MHTSLARRQRHRRALQRRPKAGGSALRRVAIAIPILLLVLAVFATGTGLMFAVGTYNHYAAGLPDPKEALDDLQFEQQTRIYDRTGKIELARLGILKREVVAFDTIPGEMIDATTAIEDKDFWENAGLRSGRHRLGRPGHHRRQAPRRQHDHPAARPGPPPARVGLRGHDLRTQAARDHPVDPPDRGVSRARKARSRSSRPT